MKLLPVTGKKINFRKKHRVRNISIFILSFFCCMSFFGMLVIPFFNKQDNDGLSDLRAEHEKLLGITGDVSPSGGNVVGDMVWWENDYARLEVYPHTGINICSQTQYANVTWKYPDNNIDLAFRFPFQLDTSLCDIWLWQNISHNVKVKDYDYIEQNYTLYNISDFELISEPEFVDFGDIPSDYYATGNASYYDDVILEWTEGLFFVGFDSWEWLNPEHTNANFTYTYWGIIGHHFEEQYWFGWNSYKSSFQHQQLNDYDYYYVTNVPVKQNHEYKVKWQYNIPVNSNGKWELMAKLSSDTIQEALSSGHYVMIDPWWDSSWDYYKVININNPLEDYCTKIVVGNSSGGDVDCESHANSDFSDLRFVRTDNSTLLNYWYENYTSNDEITLWINNSYNDSSILMYYGNSGASSVSNGSNTFEFFDDFEETSGNTASKWTVRNDAYYENGYISDDSAFRGDTSCKYGHAAEAQSSQFYITNFCSVTDDFRALFWHRSTSADRDVTYMGVEEIAPDPPTEGGRLTFHDNNDIKVYTSGWVDTGIDYTINTWTRTEMRFVDVDDVFFVNVDNTDSANNWHGYRNAMTKTDNFYISCNSIAPTGYIDCVAIMNYTNSTEPSWGSFGSEQTEAPANNAPTFANEAPTNQSTLITISPTIYVVVSDADAEATTCDFYTSTDGESWTWVQTNSSVASGTNISYDYSGASLNSTRYYWRITADDGVDNSSDTYEFVTGTAYFNISIESSNYTNYGFYYPVTYIFDIPHMSNLKCYRVNDSEIGTWYQLPEKTTYNNNSPTTVENGINMVRFDYDNDTAYVSVGMSSTSNYTIIKFTKSDDTILKNCTYNSIARYYDNRKAVVTLTWDDWNDERTDDFRNACNITQERNLWASPGIITRNNKTANISLLQTTWNDIDAEITEGKIEPSSHSRRHPHLPNGAETFSLDWEILGCKNDILANITMPYGQFVHSFSIPYGADSNEVHATCGEHYYLVDRDTYTAANATLDLTSYDGTNVMYDRSKADGRMGSDAGETNPATLNSSYDTNYNANGVYHLMCHPYNVDWDAYGKFHYNHISNHTDVWYVGYGSLYLYHYGYDKNIPVVSLMIDDVSPSAAPVNNAPTFSNEAPTNQSSGISTAPYVYVVVSDADDDSMTCDFYSYTDGIGWIWQQTNSSVASGTNISYPYIEASSKNTKYYWKVTANDGIYNSTSDFYEFTTAPAATAPTFSNEAPTNGSNDISVTPMCYVVCNDINPDTLVVDFYDNVSGGAVGASENWWNESGDGTDWGYRKLITIDHNQVDATFTNFPILVNISGDSNLADNSQTDKDDIVFVLHSDNSTILNHEIENAGSDFIDAWVNITSLSSTEDTKIWMYYGNATCDSQENSEDTWNSNYVAVWHLNQTTGDYLDSTSNNNDGTWTAGGSSVRTGVAQIGDFCPNFDGSGDNDYIQVTDDNSLDFTSFSVEFWFYPDSATHESGIISHNDLSAGWNVEQWHATACEMMIQNGEGNTVVYDGVATGSGSWLHEFICYDDTNVYFYRDGSAVAANPQALAISEINRDLYIGSANPATLRYETDGRLDEIRLSNVMRNSSWVITTYNTMKNVTTFTTNGSEEEYTAGTSGWDWIDGWTGQTPGTNLSFNFTNATGYNTKYWWNVTADDGTFNSSDIYYFTTGEAERTPTVVFNHWFTCGNITIRTPAQVFDYWFTGGNITERTPSLIFDYWFNCGNVSAVRSSTEVFNYWFTGGNITDRSPTEVFDYWFQCNNGTIREVSKVFDYYFTGGNGTLRTPSKIFDYWFQCSNDTLRTPALVFDYWFTGGNITERVPSLIFDYWFVGGNITERNPVQVFDYYFNCGNITGRTSTQVFDYYFTGGNITERTPTQVFNYYFVGGNITERTPSKVFDYYFNGGNITAIRNPTGVFNYYFTGGNITERIPTQVFNYYFNGGNITERTSSLIFDYYFTGGNITERNPVQVFDYYFNCGNITGRTSTQVFNYYFNGGNITERTSSLIFDYWFKGNNGTIREVSKVFDYYFTGGNGTLRTPSKIFDYWFQCSNDTLRTPALVFDYWFTGGNITERVPSLIFDYWFVGGNITERNPVQVFDYYFNCGNITAVRTPTQVFNYWFDCGNESEVRNPTQTFNYYFTGGNITERTTTPIFNHWFTCGNTSIPSITITNIYPSNNSNNIELQPYLYATFNSTTGNNLNITWYYNGSALTTESNVNNGTYNELLFEAINRATNYTWTVKVNDGEGNWLNRSYNFQTEGYLGVKTSKNTLAIIAIGLSIFGMLAFILLYKRKRRE